MGISIHALLAESDLSSSIFVLLTVLFLSTLSLRRATSNYGRIHNVQIISIHALLAESDSFLPRSLASIIIFLSTLSLRRATRNGGRSWMHVLYFYPRSPCGERQLSSSFFGIDYYISIHALLAESDPNQCEIYQKRSSISIHALLAESDRLAFFYIAQHIYFYPRSPCGERPPPSPPKTRVLYFYPRSPCGERRPASHLSKFNTSHFYPRSPCGERQV